MRKIKLLFVIESLSAAGAEKSLTALLHEIDYEKYDVDLQLFSFGGTFQAFLPEQVTLLKSLPLFKRHGRALHHNMMSIVGLRYIISRISYSALLRLIKLNNLQKAKWLWKTSKYFLSPESVDEYDVAISYAQGLPTYYVANSVKAKNKVAWVNVSLTKQHLDNGFQLEQYNKFDRINVVSDASTERFLAIFPTLKNKLTTIYDINSKKLTDTISNSSIDSSIMDGNSLRILTCGRLSHQKGYDLAIESAKYLKELGIEFKWYFLGEGHLRTELQELVNSCGLSNEVKFLGVHTNPLALMKLADVYVQPSRFEGFGLALFEARMMGKPCIATNFETAHYQIKDKHNGLVVDMCPQAIAKAVIRYIDDPEFTNTVIKNQSSCKFYNEEEYVKFDKMIKKLLQ